MSPSFEAQEAHAIKGLFQMKSLSTTDTSIRLCLEQMSCRDKGGYKQNNTSAGSHPSIWL